MQKVETKALKKRLRSSYFTSIISISLVLFLLGLIGLLLLNTRKISNFVKENIGFTIYLNGDTRETDIFRLQKILDTKKYIKETNYVTAEQAANEFQEELGENFIEFLGYNPLLSSINVKLIADYANSDSIKIIEKDLQTYSEIKEVDYQPSLIKAVNENVQKISLFLLAISGILTLISLALINNTIRLSIYSKRFLIRTMQLVGATGTFIRKPFLFRSIIHGFYGSLIAIVLLSGFIYYIEKEMKSIIGLKDFKLLGILFAGVIITGVLINLLSTYLAVNRYLKIKTDYLYT